jgi:hypothetical protein
LVKLEALFSHELSDKQTTVYRRGGKYSGPWDQWSQKIFYAGRKKTEKEEKGERKKEKKEKEGQKKKDRKKKRVTAPISSHFVQLSNY